RFPEYPRIAAEAPLPQTVAQNYYPIAIRRLCFPGGLRHVVLLRENPAQRGLDSEHREEIGRDLMELNLLRRRPAGEGPLIERGDRGHLFEDVIVLPPFVEIVRPHSTMAAALQVLFPNHHQLLRLTVRERAQHHCVGDAEDGAASAGPPRQAQRGYDCKYRPAAQQA